MAGNEEHPFASIRIMDDALFARGQAGPAEGGPKGIDIDASQNVLAVASEHRPLARIVPLRVLGRDTRCKQRTSPCTPVCEIVHCTCYKSGSCCAGEASRARSAGVANVACRGR